MVEDAGSDDGTRAQSGPTPDESVAARADVPEEGTLLFTYRRGDSEREGLLVRAGETVLAWENHCQHWIDVRLDKGSGAPTRDGELVCGRHGATFEADSGLCTFGPCEGAYLDSIPVEVRGGRVFLADDADEFVALGGVERDPADLSSNRGVGL